jgi:hypothetical protein
MVDVVVVYLAYQLLDRDVSFDDRVHKAPGNAMNYLVIRSKRTKKSAIFVFFDQKYLNKA